MSWFAEGFIDINTIKPNIPHELGEESFCDSDKDEDIERINNETAIIIENDKLDKNNVTGDIEPDTDENKTQKYLKFKCKVCEKSYTRNNDLKRHYLKSHEASFPSSENGKSVCLTCGRKFYHIVDLKKHLAEAHEFILKNKQLTFGSQTGLFKIHFDKTIINFNLS